MVMLGSRAKVMTAKKQVSSGGGKDLIFVRPQDLSEDWYLRWEGLVTDMRRESAALPMNTMMTLLIERIATMYVQVRRQEDAKALDWEQLRGMQKLFLNFMTEFSTQLHRNSQTPEQRFVAGFKAAVNAAVRQAGPEATVRELLPILAEELREYDVLPRLKRLWPSRRWRSCCAWLMSASLSLLRSARCLSTHRIWMMRARIQLSQMRMKFIAIC